MLHLRQSPLPGRTSDSQAETAGNHPAVARPCPSDGSNGVCVSSHQEWRQHAYHRGDGGYPCFRADKQDALWSPRVWAMNKAVRKTSLAVVGAVIVVSVLWGVFHLSAAAASPWMHRLKFAGPAHHSTVYSARDCDAETDRGSRSMVNRCASSALDDAPSSRSTSWPF